ncbi:ATP-grasp domain-containing protein [Ornithinibacillus bavariensis]|uniref:Alpha-L-glutamate ligase n=1 Tax=Ornithinibacillus bavariensis TaxID=545502 RepID=A0A920C7H8_9BACI|nr:ATP-grasp domain-containing protein [Ornithinibacillus bavariensis]GIO27688.1 alpha-L-glutamate ligase [Ornithinibacillus bavariensis]
MINGWLIYNGRDALENKAYIEWFIEEGKKQSLHIALILREHLSIGIYQNMHSVFYHGVQVDLPRFAIVRTVEPMMNRILEELGVPVFNSSTLSEICNDKARTYFEVAKLGIPMVDTVFINRENILETPPMSYPFVIKEVTGRGGKNVFLIKNFEEWVAYTQQLTASDYVIQSTEVQLGKDLRVFVVGSEIVGAVMRMSQSDFRANYKLGGTATWYPLNSDEKKLILKIISQFDFGMVGIDFLIGHQGELLFNEIEDVVGSRTLSAVSDVNILEKYVTFIKERVAKDI